MDKDNVEKPPVHKGQAVSKAYTTKMTCLSCKASFVILKGCELECGGCDKFGNTSFRMSEGRAWGRRHRFWKDWVRSVWYLTEDDKITHQTIALFENEPEEIHDYLFIKKDNNSEQTLGRD